MKETTCNCCQGTGKIIDREGTGKELRAKRVRLRVSGAEIARKLGTSRGHVRLLEEGGRPWTPELIVQYEKALEETKSELLNAIG